MITALSIGTGGLGRFGNQLFTIASTIGIARMSGQPFGFPKWINHDNALFGGKADEMSQFFVNPLPDYIPEIKYQDYGYFWEYRDIFLPTGNWNMNAHLQSVKWFIYCIDEVRNYFTFKDEPEQNDYVAVHYRAGDYIDNPEAYHPRQPKEYYERAMALFPKNTKFIIFSDNILEFYKLLETYPIGIDDEKFILLGYDTFYFPTKNYIEDFKLMKSCKSFICANSSYSHMAALLGTHPEKKIIMPKLWFGKQAGGLNFDTLYPPGAIVL